MIDTLLNFPGLYLLAKNSYSKYVYCNENFAELVGLDSPHQIIGKTDFDLFPDSLAKGYQYGDRCALNNHVYKNRKEVLLDKNNLFSILTTKEQTANSSGSTTGVMVMSIDISKTNFDEVNQYSLRYDEYSGRYYFPSNINMWLTRREYDVFNGLYQGLYTAKALGSYLKISARTVEGTLNIIKRKFGCRHKSQIIESATRMGIILPGSIKT